MNPILALLNDAARKLIDIFWPKQAFSWQSVFWLSVFSWGLAWLSWNDVGTGLLPFNTSSSDDAQTASDELIGTSRVLFTMAWVFLTVAIGWVLAAQKLVIPILGIKLKPAIWATSALTSGFLFEVWEPNSRPLVFISWPIIFAIYAVLPKIFSFSSGQFVLPSPPVRQQLVITTLICLVVSCLFRSNFLLQRWIDDFPALQVVRLETNGIMQPVREPRPILDIVDKTLQDELGVLSIPEVRRWMVRNRETVPVLNAVFRENLNAARESTQWELEMTGLWVSDPEFELYLWPTDVDTPIGLMRICNVKSTNQFSAEDLELRAQVFDDVPDERETQSPDPQSVDEQDETSEVRSIAQQLWRQLRNILGMPVDSQGTDDDNRDESSRPGIDGQSDRASNFPSPSESLVLRNNPSQVICQPPETLVLQDSIEER